MKTPRFALLFLLLTLTAQAGDAVANRSPRFIVNLLDYVAGDYAGAVQNGKVVSASEYREQREFAASALETAIALPETKNSAEIRDRITVLKSLVDRKAPAEAVAKQAQEAKSEVIRVTRIAITPTSWPNLNKGKQLFAQNCATCHGITGKGDGPAGRSLNPSPANFYSDKMRELSPFKAFNAIRVGVPGTGMPGFNSIPDQDVWNLSFYINSLRHLKDAEEATHVKVLGTNQELSQVSTLSDDALLQAITGSANEKHETLIALRLYTRSNDEGSSLSIAKGNLKDSGDQYKAGNFDAAKTAALKAYLEGVEPAEPKLRANDPSFTSALEEKMAAVRMTIDEKKPEAAVQEAIRVAQEALQQAETLLIQKEASPWVAFLIAAGILLREGFEAVLILIALLAVIRASGSRRAAIWVHGGWISALGIGILAWFFSGWLVAISGAGREMMEAVTSGIAVVVLLYMGFWLHNKTEIYRWKQFIDVQVKTALAGSNLFGLAAISFMAVFREAFETVLFLRAVWIEGGSEVRDALTLGVFTSLGLLFIASWAIVKYSARLPIRKVFSLSSLLMIVLAVVLAGKGLHSLQETGFMGARSAGMSIRVDVLGIFPTRETILAQFLVVAVSIGLWQISKRPARPPSQSERQGV